MAYVREKTVRNRKTGKVYSYYQLVEGVWTDGRVRQRVLAHLGEHPTLEMAKMAAGREVGLGVKATHEGTDKASRIDAQIRERWGDQLREYKHTFRLPELEEVLRKAYPKGFDGHPRRGQKFRRAFGLSDKPGETLKSVGEFAVLLKRYWKATEEWEKHHRAYDRAAHLRVVEEYLEEKQDGRVKNFEEYKRYKEQLERDLAQLRLEPLSEDDV